MLNPLTDRHQIWNTWLRRGHILPRKIRGQSAQGFLPPTYVKYTPKTFECLLLFFSLSSEPPQTSLLDRFSRLIRHTTWFCARKCLLGVRKINFKIWPIYSKNSKNSQWRLWGNFDKILNCHNSGCMQDRVVNFDSRVGFSGTAYLTASFKFSPRLPLLPWQRNLGQNRL